MKIVYRVLFLLFVIPFVSVSANTKGNHIEVTKSVDWQKQEIRFVLRVAVDQAGLPNSRQQAEGWIERERLRIIAQSLDDVIFDSRGSFAEHRSKQNIIQWNLDAAAALAKREYASLSADLRYLEATYILSINDIMRNISVQTAQRIEPLITNGQRDFDYSGIVIFVTAELPLHGSFNHKGRLEPALAPIILDENGETLLSIATIDSTIFHNGMGGIEYTWQTNMYQWSPRKIGFNPLIISAVAVTGEENTTDIVLSQRDADRLRASSKAITMLQQAKILIVMQG